MSAPGHTVAGGGVRTGPRYPELLVQVFSLQHPYPWGPLVLVGGTYLGLSPVLHGGRAHWFPTLDSSFPLPLLPALSPLRGAPTDCMASLILSLAPY